MATTTATEPSPPACAAGLAEGVELIGEYRGSGRIEPSYLIRLAGGRMLEVSPLIFMVASELGHRRRLTEIAIGVGARWGRTISPESVAYLIDQKLRPLGIVESEAGAARAPAPVLGLAVHAGVLPTRLVRAVTVVLRPLFLPPIVVAVLATLAMVEAWLLLAPGSESGFDAMLLHPATLATVIGLTLVAGVFHELGHATASRYGGAEPGVIGAGIYLIWPVFYNDLNDSYRLSRAGRLRADLGGVYFNAIFILGLAAAHGVTGFSPLLVAIAVQHLAVLQQFMPFLRLDGYYIVSDMAGVPDLFKHIRPVLASMLPGRPRAASVTELQPRARLIVTGWVLLSVPLLAGCLILLATSLPRLISTAWTAAAVQAGLLESSLRSGASGAALLSALQLVILAVPFIGLGIALRRLLERGLDASRPVRRQLSPTHHGQGATPRTSRILLRLIVALVGLQAVALPTVILT